MTVQSAFSPHAAVWFELHSFSAVLTEENKTQIMSDKLLCFILRFLNVQEQLNKSSCLMRTNVYFVDNSRHFRIENRTPFCLSWQHSAKYTNFGYLNIVEQFKY